MASVIDSDTRTIVAQELEKLRQRIVDNIKASGQTASGRTAESLRVEDGVLYGREKFGTMETGRKAGKVPTDFTTILEQWAKDKGFTFSSAEEQAKTIKAIYWTIVKKGTRLHRQGGRADVYSNEIPATIEAIESRVLKAFVKEIQSNHIKLNK